MPQIPKFINRYSDLRDFEEEVNVSSLVVLMGRRRVGKTELIREWARRGGAMAYSQAIEKASMTQQIDQIWADIKNSIALDIAPKSWEELLKLMTLPDEKLVFVLDEFPYLVASDPSLPSRIQKWLDHQCPAHITLCLAGSSQTMMRQLFFDEKSALYGRARRIFNIRPLGYRYFCEAIRINPSNQASFVLFSLVGGIPKYWQAFQSHWSPTEAAEQLFFAQNAFFDNEMLRLTSDENISSVSAMAALEAIGRGAHKPSEIAGRLGIKQTSLNKILSALVTSYIVKREIPFGESERSSKRSLYRVTDPFVRFYYSVVSPHSTRWSVYDNMTHEKLLNDHASVVFEDSYRSLFPSAARYFEGGDIEIDCVRFSDENTLVVSEVKFRNVDVKEKAAIIERLKHKVARSKLAKMANSYAINYEVVDWEKGVEDILSLQRE